MSDQISGCPAKTNFERTCCQCNCVVYSSTAVGTFVTPLYALSLFALRVSTAFQVSCYLGERNYFFFLALCSEVVQVSGWSSSDSFSQPQRVQWLQGVLGQWSSGRTLPYTYTHTGVDSG